MRSSLKVFIYTGLLFSALSLGGCTEDRGETEKRILAHDSSFQKLIDQRNSIQKELDSLKAVYMEKEQGIDARIAALKKKSSEIKSEYLDSIEKIKRQIYPRKRSLQQELAETRRRLKQKKIELSDIRRNIGEIDSLINKKERLSLTREEIRVWGERLSSLSGKSGAVEKEIDRLEKEIEITGLKIKVLDVK